MLYFNIIHILTDISSTNVTYLTNLYTFYQHIDCCCLFLNLKEGFKIGQI